MIGLGRPDQKNLEAALPLTVRIFGPDNTPLPYTQPTASDGHGAWQIDVRLSDLMDKPGVYRVEVEETTTGKRARQTVSVNALE